jgi:hypothetical protein
MPCTSCNPPGASREVIHLVEDQQGAGLAGQRPQPGEKAVFGRDAAGGALHRFDQDRRELGPVRPDQLLDRGEIVVAAEQKLERRIERATVAAEIKDAAVIAAGEHQNLGAAGDRARGADRHQIGLGAGVGEAHQLDRWKAGAHRCGKARLGLAMRAEIEPAGERVFDRAADKRVRMAVDAGGELAQEIGVFVAVEVPQTRPLAARHRQRERVDMDRGAGVAARHGLARGAVLGEALRVIRAVTLLGLGERRREVDIGGAGLGHRQVAPQTARSWRRG